MLHRRGQGIGRRRQRAFRAVPVLGEQRFGVGAPVVALLEKNSDVLQDFRRPGVPAVLDAELDLRLQLGFQGALGFWPQQVLGEVGAEHDDDGPVVRPSGTASRALNDSGPDAFGDRRSCPDPLGQEPILEIVLVGLPSRTTTRHASPGRSSPSYRLASPHVACTAAANGSMPSPTSSIVITGQSACATSRALLTAVSVSGASTRALPASATIAAVSTPGSAPSTSSGKHEETSTRPGHRRRVRQRQPDDPGPAERPLQLTAVPQRGR